MNWQKGNENKQSKDTDNGNWKTILDGIYKIMLYGNGQEMVFSLQEAYNRKQMNHITLACLM